jgi:hypothetical protein
MTSDDMRDERQEQRTRRTRDEEIRLSLGSSMRQSTPRGQVNFWSSLRYFPIPQHLQEKEGFLFFELLSSLSVPSNTIEGFP